MPMEQKTLKLLKFQNSYRIKQQLNRQGTEKPFMSTRLTLRFFLLCICSGTLYAQQHSSLQEQAQAILLQGAHINHFNRLCPQEKVYLHFDNTAYFQGETIWFSATVLDATTGSVAASKVLYVELLSPTGVVLRQQKLQVVDGRCHGSLPLVDPSVEEANEKRGVLSYPSGYYEVRAYTRTMLNFDAHGCFSRVFPVYKSPEKEGDYSNPELDIYKAAGIERPETEGLKELNLDFLPEGGHLIAGVKNRIAFKATGRDGQGVTIESLTDAAGTVIALSPQHRGMGSFLFTPTERRSKVKARYGGKDYTFTLPEAEAEGYALCLTPQDDNTLQVAIATQYPDAGHLLGYTLVRHGKCELIDTLTMRANTFSRTVRTHKLPTGVYQFSLFDAEGTLYATRMLFVNNGVPTVPVTVTTNKKSYAPFEQVRLRLQVEGEGNHHLSLAVRDAADYGTGYTDDLRSYMLLSSELKGYIEHPEYYFESDDEEHRTALDRLMLVQGWSRYDWQRMSGNTPFAPSHYTEGALVLDGWALHPRKDEPMAGIEVKVKLYSPDRQQVQEMRSVTDENGYWGAAFQDFEGEWDLNLQTYRDGEPVVARLRLERATAPDVIAYETGELHLQHRIDSTVYTPWMSEVKKDYLGEKSIVLDNVEVEGKRKYIDYCTFQAFNVAKDAELMTDRGEYTYTVADYLVDKGYEIEYSDGVTFEQSLNEGMPKTTVSSTPSSSEIRSEYISWLIRKSTINSFRTLWYIKEGKNNATEPSYLPGFDIDIADVKSIIVYDSPHSYMGNVEIIRDFGVGLIEQVQKPKPPFPAGLYVVEIHLYPGRKTPTSWNKNTRQTTFDGYSPKMEFYAPEYSDGPIEGDVDYRRTIYWNPELETDESGNAEVEFYNNGYSRSLSVSVEGMAADRIPIVYQEAGISNEE